MVFILRRSCGVVLDESLLCMLLFHFLNFRKNLTLLSIPASVTLADLLSRRDSSGFF